MPELLYVELMPLTGSPMLSTIGPRASGGMMRRMAASTPSQMMAVPSMRGAGRGAHVVVDCSVGGRRISFSRYGSQANEVATATRKPATRPPASRAPFQAVVIEGAHRFPTGARIRAGKAPSGCGSAAALFPARERPICKQIPCQRRHQGSRKHVRRDEKQAPPALAIGRKNTAAMPPKIKT